MVEFEGAENLINLFECMIIIFGKFFLHQNRYLRRVKQCERFQALVVLVSGFIHNE